MIASSAHDVSLMPSDVVLLFLVTFSLGAVVGYLARCVWQSARPY